MTEENRDELGKRGIARRRFTPEEIMGRILAVMQAEGRAILEEGVAASPEAIDVVIVNGYGFPRWRGGPMWLAQTSLKLVKIESRLPFILNMLAIISRVDRVGARALYDVRAAAGVPSGGAGARLPATRRPASRAEQRRAEAEAVRAGRAPAGEVAGPTPPTTKTPVPCGRTARIAFRLSRPITDAGKIFSASAPAASAAKHSLAVKAPG